MELVELEKAIEGSQFVAQANSILETETATEKVRDVGTRLRPWSMFLLLKMQP